MDGIREKRLHFAREHKNHTLEQRKKVMWSDESRVTGGQEERQMKSCTHREPSGSSCDGMFQGQRDIDPQPH